MQNENKTEVLELSPAELELIKNKREQDELKAKEAKIQLDLRIEKIIKNEEKNIEVFKKEQLNKNTFIECKFGEIKLMGYEIVSKTYSKSFEGSYYSWKDIENDKVSTKVIVFNKDVEYEKKTILRKDTNLYLNVSTKYVSKSNRVTELCLRISDSSVTQRDSSYTNVNTAVSKIEEYITKQKVRKEAAIKKLSLKENAELRLKDLFPMLETKVEARYVSGSTYGGRRGSEGYEVLEGTIKLINGISIGLNIEEKGLSIKSVTGISKLDPLALIELLGGLERKGDVSTYESEKF